MSSLDRKLVFVGAAAFFAWIILHLVTSRTKNLATPDLGGGGGGL